MSELRNIAIIGTGLAGVTAAATLRDEGFDGRIVLIGDEPDLPYDRPPLSKKALEAGPDDASALLYAAGFYEERGVDLLRGCCVTAIELAGAPYLRLAGGETMPFDRLLLATGVSARKLLSVNEAELPLHYLRTLADARALRSRLKAGSRILIVGGGFIGLEVASTARKLGCEVTVIEADPRLLSRVAPVLISDYVKQLHEANGVRVITCGRLQRLTGSATEVRAMLEGGEAITADAAVIGIGAIPNTALAEHSGIAVDNGITVNGDMRTSCPLVFAAGDVCNHWNGIHGRQVRLESWQNAQRQGRAAAKAMLGKPQAYCEAPWFWSDQFDMNLQSVGVPLSWDAEVVRGDPASGKFCQFLLKDGRIVGANFVNEGRHVRPTRDLIDRALPVDAKKLADPKQRLRDVQA